MANFINSLEQVALQRLDDFRGNLSSNRNAAVQISPLNQICMISDNMICIYVSLALPIYR